MRRSTFCKYNSPSSNLLATHTNPVLYYFHSSPFKYLNTICFQGPQYYYSNLSSNYARIQGTGHWGNNAYNGCKGVRCGDSK